jgi:hypothetical protein
MGPAVTETGAKESRTLLKRVLAINEYRIEEFHQQYLAHHLTKHTNAIPF